MTVDAPKHRRTCRHRQPATIHPLWLRVTHWINAVAVIVMIGSGWEIYNASPLFSFAFPKSITSAAGSPARCCGTSRRCGCSWSTASSIVVLGIATGRFRRKLLPLRAGEVVADTKLALRGALSHDDLAVYNALQKLLYLGVIVAGVVIVLSGLAMWKPVQLWWLAALFGGYEPARYVHFFAMAAIVGFSVIHVVMAFVVPKALRAMIMGR